MMKKGLNERFWGFIGKFTLVHVMTYTAVAVIFLFIQEALPASGRIALDFFQPYRSPGLAVTFTQILRGIVLALILYPFYDTIVKGNRSWLVLFGALWGLALFGSVEPIPGSIEGFIYTETTWLEHFMVLAAAAVQVGLFTRLFLRWEQKSDAAIAAPVNTEISDDPDGGIQRKVTGYLKRFTLLHVISYWFVGMLFYQLTGYEEALATMEAFELFRPLESLAMVGVVFFGQIFRGGILAMLLYPFYSTFMKKKLGWLLLFALIYGLTALGSATFLPEFIVGTAALTTFAEFIDSMKIGIPEITVQMLVFSWLLFKWERRKNRNQITPVILQPES